jgi:hypothetical protein
MELTMIRAERYNNKLTVCVELVIKGFITIKKVECVKPVVDLYKQP